MDMTVATKEQKRVRARGGNLPRGRFETRRLEEDGCLVRTDSGALIRASPRQCIQGRLESERINMPRIVGRHSPHNNNKNPSARLRPVVPSHHVLSLPRERQRHEIPRDYSRGSVFTNHSADADSSGEESCALLPLSSPSSTSIDLPFYLSPSLLAVCPSSLADIPPFPPRFPSRPTPPRWPRIPTCPLPRGAHTHTGTRQVHHLR